VCLSSPKLVIRLAALFLEMVKEALLADQSGVS
jgi:hypothetical protein